jgi:hypothetical protein
MILSCSGTTSCSYSAFRVGARGFIRDERFVSFLGRLLPLL